jgi:hypothetical protein
MPLIVDGTLCVNKIPEIGVPRFEIINFVKRRRRTATRLSFGMPERPGPGGRPRLVHPLRP